MHIRESDNSSFDAFDHEEDLEAVADEYLVQHLRVKDLDALSRNYTAVGSKSTLRSNNEARE